MLEFELKQIPETVLEVFSITPGSIRNTKCVDILRQPIRLGNTVTEIGDWFSVSGDGSDLHHIWNGDLSRVHGLGYQMSDGQIQVNGDVGNHLGSRMTGGTIRVQGSAGHYTGAELHGGLIHVQENVGDGTGSAYDGGALGQNGGAILVQGSAGHDVGRGMRRGLIGIGGTAQQRCGFTMRAGTIMVLGGVSGQAGLEMVRGTIMLGGPTAPLATRFANAGQQKFPVTNIISRYANGLGFVHNWNSHTWNLFHGDLLCGGRGELLMAG